MLVFAVILLFANALFNLIAWPRFYPRIVLAAASAITGVVILL